MKACGLAVSCRVSEGLVCQQNALGGLLQQADHPECLKPARKGLRSDFELSGFISGLSVGRAHRRLLQQADRLERLKPAREGLRLQQVRGRAHVGCAVQDLADQARQLADLPAAGLWARCRQRLRMRPSIGMGDQPAYAVAGSACLLIKLHSWPGAHASTPSTAWEWAVLLPAPALVAQPGQSITA